MSLSGIGARTLRRCDDLATALDDRAMPLSLLFAPRTAGAEQCQTVAGWVRSRAARGDAVLLHGFDHAADPRVFGRRGEFAALPAHEAGLRLAAAGAALDRIGIGVAGFVPPRWLASAGTLTALRGRGFRLCADGASVHDLRTGTVHRGRLQAFARAEQWWCAATVLSAGRTARRGGLVRLAVDAADLDRSVVRRAVLDAVDLALGHGAVSGTYPSLLTRPALAA